MMTRPHLMQRPALRALVAGWLRSRIWWSWRISGRAERRRRSFRGLLAAVVSRGAVSAGKSRAIRPIIARRTDVWNIGIYDANLFPRPVLTATAAIPCVIHLTAVLGEKANTLSSAWAPGHRPERIHQLGMGRHQAGAAPLALFLSFV